MASSVLSLTISLSVEAKTEPVSDLAKNTADYAVSTYQKDMVNSLRELVKYNTLAKTAYLLTTIQPILPLKQS